MKFSIQKAACEVVDGAPKVLSINICVLQSIQALHDKAEISNNQCVSTFAKKLTNENKQLKLFTDFARVKVNREYIQETKLRVAPEAQGFRILINNTFVTHGGVESVNKWHGGPRRI